MNKKAAIIIVSWNGKQFLQNCFNALEKQTYKNFDIYFVDNGSTDGSADFIQEKFSNTKLIRLSQNTGFAGGSNEGIRAALQDKDVEVIICLNNDTIVEPEWCSGLISAVDLKNKVDMVSSKTLFTDGKIQTVGLRFEKDLIGTAVGGLSIGYKMSPDEFNEPMKVFCPSGVSCLYTRRLLEEVGLFDEDLFAYSEDLDLGIRARQKGYKAVFSPTSKLVHLHSSSSGGAASPLKAYLIKRNNYLVAIKDFSIGGIAVFILSDIVWNVKAFFEKDKDKSANQLKGKIGGGGMVRLMGKVYWGVLILAPRMIAKRFKKQRF